MQTIKFTAQCLLPPGVLGADPILTSSCGISSISTTELDDVVRFSFGILADNIFVYVFKEVCIMFIFMFVSR